MMPNRRLLLALLLPCTPNLVLPGRMADAQTPSPAAKTVTIEAPSIGRKTAYNILLPADYEASGDKRYPVLYLLHGYSGNYANWAGMGAGGAAKGLDLIVVMPDGGNSWYLNWAESADGQKNAWDDFVAKDLIGHVDSTYRTIAAREGRAINGLSMGGYGGLTLGLRHPDLYCSIGSHSGALAFAKGAADRLRSGQEQAPRKNQPSDTPNDKIKIEGFRSQAERTPKGKPFIRAEDADAADPFKLVLAVPKEKLPHIYLDCGTEDRLIGASRDFAKLLTENNIPHVYGESAGAHNGQYWTREVGTSMAVQYAVLRRSLAQQMAGLNPEAGVKIEKDIAYLGPDREEKLDLYLPSSPPKAGVLRPGIVIIHGGGWTGGDKGAAREINIGTTLAEHGYVCISINYALATPGHPTWPTNLKDCKRAVRWLRKNSEKYRIDPAHIGAIGGSAGGHLTAMLAVTGPEDGLEPEGDADVSSRVQAAVPMYAHMAASMDRDGIMFPGKKAEVPDLYRAATPINHVTKDDPPMLLLHGTADTTTPLSQSERFDAKLEEIGLDHLLVIVEGAPHSFHLQPKQRDLRELVIGFFDRHLKR